MSSPIHSRVLREIEGLHDFFVGWFNGTLPESAFASGFLSHFSEDFVLITPSDNGRLATVLFSTTEPLQWLHVHETWLPSDIMSKGPYDF